MTVTGEPVIGHQTVRAALPPSPRRLPAQERRSEPLDPLDLVIASLDRTADTWSLKSLDAGLPEHVRKAWGHRELVLRQTVARLHALRGAG
jgi:hypothetical protein